MADIALIGVPSQSGGRPIGVARGVGALRAAGIVAALREAGHDVHDAGDVALPRPDPARDGASRVVNPRGLSALVRAVAQAVRAARDARRFPLVLGGDCPILLGGSYTLRDGGLLHVDGHEDAYLPEQSPSGDSADSEVAFALGIAPFSWDRDLEAAQPFLRFEHVAMLGPRDRPDLDRHGVESLAGRCRVIDDVSARADIAAATRDALAVARSAPDGFWFHLDWDVLANDQIGAVIFPRSGGLAWEDVASIARASLADPACRGWSAGTYNPDLDPEGTDAVAIVDLIAGASRALGQTAKSL